MVDLAIKPETEIDLSPVHEMGYIHYKLWMDHNPMFAWLTVHVRAWWSANEAVHIEARITYELMSDLGPRDALANVREQLLRKLGQFIEKNANTLNLW